MTEPVAAPEAIEAPTGDDQTWISLPQAAEATGVSVSSLRKWYRAGRIDSRMEVGGIGGRQRLVPLEAVIAHAQRTGARPIELPVAGPVASGDDGEAEGEGLDSVVPASGGFLVPRDAWDSMVSQLGNLHQAGQELAEARERAAKAETEAAFLRDRLAEIRNENDQLKTSPSWSSTSPAGSIQRRRWWRRVQ